MPLDEALGWQIAATGVPADGNTVQRLLSHGRTHRSRQARTASRRGRSPSAIDLRRHKKTFVHLLSTEMAHKSLHTVLWHSAVNEAPRLVTCFDIVTDL